MRLLLIKTSSIGDIIHTFPALSDAKQAHANLSIDWLIEEDYAEMPTWHAAQPHPIKVALRKWRKGIFSRVTHQAWRDLRKSLREKQYDLILDAQGLVKSAWLVFLAKGLRAGLDFSSAREGLAALAYQRKCKVDFYQHAVLRMRALFSQALKYPLPETPPDFGLDASQFFADDTDITENPYLVFLHGTTWASKEWPEPYWIRLAQYAQAAGFKVKVSSGNEREKERARRMVAASPAIEFINCPDIKSMAKLLVQARAVVSVDTGFGHLAAAFNVPTISLYGSTHPDFTGALGLQAKHLLAHFSCAPCLRRTCRYNGPTLVTPACFATISPERVWGTLKSVLNA